MTNNHKRKMTDREKVIKAARGMIICGEHPSYESLTEKTNISLLDIHTHFQTMDDLLFAAGYHKIITYRMVNVNDRVPARGRRSDD